MIKFIVKFIVDFGFDGIFVVIFNFVDVVINYIWEKFGFFKNKVIGIGIVLDLIRFRRILFEEIGIV